jgi:competence protein ComEC
LVLISSDGVLVGLLGEEGRALSSPRGAGFAAESWLADDGDLALPEEAALRPGFAGPKGARRFVIGDFRGAVLSGKGGLAAVPSACAEVDIVILPAALGPAGPVRGGCLVVDRALLDQTGAIALQARGQSLRLVPVRRVARLWLGERPVAKVVTLTPRQAQLASRCPAALACSPSP